jgi:hypothetical protein
MGAEAEKRQHHRFMARLDMRVVSGDRVAAGLQLTTIDIGVGGARCVSPSMLANGTLLHLTVTLTGGNLVEPQSIALDAQVLRCVGRPEPHYGFPFEAALHFVRLDTRDRRRLQGYLNSL